MPKNIYISNTIVLVMKKRTLLLVLSLVVLQVSFVSAGIFFSDVESKYNIGDMIDLDVSVDPIQEGYLLKVDLVCDDNNVLTFNNLPEGDGEVNIKLPLNFHTLDQVSGQCYFDGDYAGDVRRSGDFEISKRLSVRLTSDSFYIYPGESVTISGFAERLNGMQIDGEVEITIPLLKALEVVVEENVEENLEVEEVVEGEVVVNEGVVNEETQEEEEVQEEEVVEEIEESDGEAIEEGVEEVEEVNAGTYYGKVVEGEFSVTFELNGETPAGDYRIDVIAYEDISGEKASEGVAIANLQVFQVLKDVEIVLSNQNFNPGERIDLRVNLLDQAKLNIDDEVSIIIMNEIGERIYEKIVQAGETVNYDIPTNIPSGYYDIEANKGEFSNVQRVYVNEKATVAFEIEEQSLVVTNIGNVVYDKDIEVELNGKSFVKSVKLALGEAKKLKLTGANEEYDILVRDGESELSRSGVLLTGRAVNVDSVSELGSFPIIMWIFIIVLLAIGVLFLFRNVFKKKSYAHFKDMSKVGKDVVGDEKDKRDSKREVKEDKKDSKDDGKNGEGMSQAEQVLV